MLRLGMTVIGAVDVERAERFWSAALDYERREIAMGGHWRILRSVKGDCQEVAIQRSDEEPRQHPRLHLDLWVDGAAEQEAEAERLVRLGAARIEWDRYPADPDFVVLADTEGNRFCIVDVNHVPAD